MKRKDKKMYHDFDMNKVLDHLKTTKRKKLILDTDTFNEIDDQFAIAYAMLAEDIDILAITAAPFHNTKSTGPADGMEKSYEEILRVIKHVDPEDKLKTKAYRGSKEYMKGMIRPVESEAADKIVELVKEADDIVYIAVIGCFTNVASALLKDPTIADKAVVVMVGGERFEFGNADEFNLMQDHYAAKVIFESGIPVILLPAVDCTERIYTTGPELLYYLEDKNDPDSIGNYLCKIWLQDEGMPVNDGKCNTTLRTIWDIASIAFMRMQEKACDYYEFKNVEIVPSHSIDMQGNWYETKEYIPGSGGKLREMIYVKHFNRNAVFSDFYTVIRNRPAFK